MIRKIGIIGASQMGTGIAETAIIANFPVLLYDQSMHAIETALETIAMRLARRGAAGQFDAEKQKQALQLITPCASMHNLADCDCVIEAATENEQIKRDVFINLCKVLQKNALIATNTSTISITRLAATTDRPEKFIGLHFMKPVAHMKLVEVVRGIATSDETFHSVQNFIHALGKVSIMTEDFPAFIVNRVLMPMINEAIYILYEGVGTVEAIDTAMKLGANHPMGPLTLADFIGLDTCLSILQVLAKDLSDSKYRPCPLLVKYVEAGWLGQKTGRGFYDYSVEPPIPTR